jgi:hypothetical protein
LQKYAYENKETYEPPRRSLFDDCFWK